MKIIPKITNSLSINNPFHYKSSYEMPYVERRDLPRPENRDEKTITNLIVEGKLHPDTILINRGCRNFNNQFLNDLDKVTYAKQNGKNLKKVFVPKFKTKNEAKKELNIGDVCSIKGNKCISIKIDRNEIKELFISPETYMELFPPVQRFAMEQGNVGDCYFISALNSIYSNPKSRHTILEMFKEDPDGTLNATLGGYYRTRSGKVLPKNEELFQLKDVKTNFSEKNKDNFRNYAPQFEAVRILEDVLRKQNKKQAYENIKNAYIDYSVMLDYFNNYNIDLLERDGMQFHKEEAELFLKLVDDIYDKEKTLDELVSIGDLNYSTSIKSSEIKEFINDKSKIHYLDELYTQIVLKRYYQMMQADEQFETLDIIMPKAVYNEIKHNPQNAKIDYLNGGHSEHIFKMLGFQSQQISTRNEENQEKIIKLLNSDYFNSRYIATAATSPLAKNKGDIISNHCYSLKQVNINGRRLFAVSNPHNASKDMIFDQEELLENFSKFTFARIQ